jgi:creatinase
MGMSLLKPGVSCSEVTEAINVFLAERDLLQYRTFGYGHSFGVLSHYYGREAGWSCARTSTPFWNPAWSSRWSRC